MPTITIKSVETNEEKSLFDKMPIYGYFPSPNPSNNSIEERNRLIADALNHREFLLFEDETAVSGGAYTILDQNIRGTIMKMGGVLNINTYPEARRKGYVNLLMKELFEQMYEEKLPLTCLYPFKPSFYGRYGYVNFPQYRDLTVEPANLRELSKIEVNNELVRGNEKKHWKDIAKLQLSILQSKHGMSVFEGIEDMPVDALRDEWIVIVKEDNLVTGAMSYSTKGIFSEVKVRNFLYLNTSAKIRLLQYIYYHNDQFTEFKIPIAPDEQPEYWAYDVNPKVESRSWVPSAQGRVLIVDKLEGIGMREGEVSISIVDEYCEWNNRPWRITADDGQMSIEEIDHADQEIGIGAFSALIYGTYLKHDFRKFWNLDVSSELVRQLTDMFPSQLPWLYSSF